MQMKTGEYFSDGTEICIGNSAVCRLSTGSRGKESNFLPKEILSSLRLCAAAA